MISTKMECEMNCVFVMELKRERRVIVLKYKNYQEKHASSYSSFLVFLFVCAWCVSLCMCFHFVFFCSLSSVDVAHGPNFCFCIIVSFFFWAASHEPFLLFFFIIN